MHALATGLAREFAPAGITVNTVTPSYTRTPGLAAAIGASAIPPRLGVVLDDAVGLIPVGRGAEPDEVAATVAFLARPDARSVTGQTISVDGGSSMG